MRILHRRLTVAVAILAAAAAYAQTPTVLNLSHDLTTHGIAGSNMVPNTPALDSRTLFKAGVAYAVKNGIATVNVDRGNYYFLTQDDAAQHVFLSISNVTIDLQYSDLYFANGNAVGFFCSGCTNVTFQNFTMDYLNLPFTQVQVTSVNATARTINFQAIPGWPAPSALNGYAIAGQNDYWGFVFRNGQELRQTGRLLVVNPFSGNTLQVSGAQAGSASANLASMQAGDIVVVTFRSGGGMVQLGGDRMVLRNISIYASADYGINAIGSSNTTLDQLQVIPRPGTDRLISSNADGIHISVSGVNNVISNSTVRRGCDDGIAIDGQWWAIVNAPNTGTTVGVTLDQFKTVPVGMAFDFISVVNASVIDTATVTAVSPAVAQQAATPGSTITLTLDHTVTLATNFGVIPHDPSLRGSGSVIRGNLVQQEVFARGIYIPGTENVTATDNYVDSTNNSGILVGEDDVLSYGFKTGPTSGLTINNNFVNNAQEFGYAAAGTVDGAAAINAYVTDQNYSYVTTTPDSNFTITGNLVTNTTRSGIRVQSLNGGTISGNTILSASLQPNDYIVDVTSGETLAQLEADFKQPVVVANSTAVTNSNNTTTGVIATSVSAAYGGLRQAPGSIVSLYGTNLASGAPASNTLATPPTTLGGASVTVTDNTGTSRLAPLYYVSPGLINYQMPIGTAPGIARVTIGSSVGGALVGTVAPGLFSADGSGTGIAAAEALLISASGIQTPVTVFQCGSNGCVATPMSLGSSTDTLELVLYGTGVQGRSSMTNVVVQIGGVPAQVLYAGSTVYPGLDQLNIVIPPSLAGAGLVPVVLMVDGQTANVLYISVL